MRAGGQAVGVLTLDHGGVAHTYTPDEIALARAVARLCGLVIERERLLREREEARANEAALREANRRMDEFLAIAGHEMRTPLTSVKGNIQVARRRLEHLNERHEVPDAAAREVVGARDLLGRADTGVARLNRLVDDLLDVSRIQAGQLRIRPERIDLAALVREVVDEHRALQPARTILVDCAAVDAIVPALADPHRIAQVVTNYLSNALRYAPPTAPVEVGLTARAADGASGTGREARVWVRDAGPGLDAVEQGRVWGQFYRVEGVGHQHGSSIGLGLGLYISRTIVEAHGGHVGVESAPGAGATFWFTLPLGDRR